MKRGFLVPLVITSILTLTACDHYPNERKALNMTALTPRLESVFAKTRTVCFGRFLVDVPESTTVVWGMSDVALGIHVYPQGVAEVQAQAQNFIDRLKSEKAINHNDVPLLFSIEEVHHPVGRIVTGYEDFQSIDEFQVNGYFRLKDDGVIIDARPLGEDKDETVALIKSIAGRLRQRAENEIPAEPGNCIEHAFLPDRLGPDKDPYGELIGIGLRLKDFPDTHLSIFINPSNPHYSESDSLEWQLNRIEKDQRAQDPNHPLLKTRYFRRGARQVHDWQDGFEGLSRTPERVEMHSIHDFALAFKGVAADPLKPRVDIRMQTGVADNSAGATKPSLSDEEAIAVWDRITSSIRVRPTGAAVKTSEVDGRPRLPLGELAVTGRVCPQTGWWEPSEPKGPRQHLKAGDRMPHLVSFGEPSIWQKLRGKRPIDRIATTWKLAAFDDETTAFGSASEGLVPPTGIEPVSHA